MAKAKYKAYYTSMEAHRESQENQVKIPWVGWKTPSSDEVYAVFLVVNWTNSRSRPSVYARRTRVYTGVDKGETRGVENSRDNKAVTYWRSRFQTIDPDKCFILVAGIERDAGTAISIQRIMNAVAKKYVKYLLFAANYDRDTAIGYGKDFMEAMIKVGRRVPQKYVSRAYLRKLQAEIENSNALSTNQSISNMLSSLKSHVWKFWDTIASSVSLAKVAIDPDDQIGGIQELRLSPGRHYLTFEEKGEGKYTYKFSVKKR